MIRVNPFTTLLRIVSVLFVFVALSPGVHSQLTSGNGFIKHNYLEVGVANCGGYGTTVAPPGVPPAPSVYHPNAALPGLGFVVDFAMDGWSAGTPNYCGDYFVPGSPVEGWGVSINGTPYINTDGGNGSCGPFDIPGSVTAVKWGTIADTIIWEGAVAGLEIAQQTILPNDSLFFLTFLTLCNTSGATLNDVYYGRNVDPDNEQPWTGNFTTFNEIVSQPSPPPGPVDALVTAEGLTHGCFIGLGSRDARARVCYGGFFTEDPTVYYNGTGGHTGTVGSTNTADEAISIGFYIGDLAPGECTCLAFAYILDAAQLGSALSATFTITVASDSTDISSSLTDVLCLGDTVTLTLGGGASNYLWDWSPATGLSSTTGLSVQAFPTTTTVYHVHGVDTTGLACSELDLDITVNVQNPKPDAGPDKATCPGNTITIGSPPSPGYVYSWSPATGLSSTSSPAPTVTLTTPGSYTYICQCTTPAGCTGADTVVVNIIPLPTVDLMLPDEGCIGQPQTVAFTGTVAPTASYIWNFGPGASPASSTALGPHNVTWSTLGMHYVSVAAVVGPCTTATVIDSIFIWPTPTAVIDPVANQCLDGNNFSFTSGGVWGPTATFWWTFGPDAWPTNSLDENPTGISFASAGIKSATLVVTEHGCSSAPATIFFEVWPQPVPDFNWAPVCIDQVIQFQDVTPGTMISWDWNFADAGATATINNPTHTFSTPGQYNVTLTVTNSNGCTSTGVETVTIHPLPAPSFTYVNKCFNQRTDFTNTSMLNDPWGSVITGYFWDFGDPASGSNTSSDTHPSHWYSAPGVYNVTLTVTSSEGCDDVIVVPIDVPPAPYLTAVQDSACPGNSLTLMATGALPGTTVVWFASATGSTIIATGNYFTTPPLATSMTYYIAMQDQEGCFSPRVPITAYMVSNPNTLFWVEPSTHVEIPNAIVEFHPTDLWTETGVQSLTWTFGDGGSSNQVDPIHQYSQPGLYTVTFTVVDSFGCVGKTVMENYITVTQQILVWVPNAFTPNGDGNNDFFKVDTRLIKSLSIWIYDRWGALVYQSDNMSFEWDGVDVKGISLQEGSYTWRYKAVAIDNTPVENAGSVMLLR